MKKILVARLLAVAAVGLAAESVLGESRTLTIVSAGDAFMVQKFPASYSPAPEMKAWIESGDARLVNFECVVNDGTCPPGAWSGGTWACMPPDVMPDLFKYGFNGCGCANNHSLDYSKEGLFMTIAALDKAGIPHAGTGKDLQEASAPAFIDSPNGRVAFISVNMAFHPDARAGLTTKLSPGRPGMNAFRNKQKFFVTPEHLAVIKEIAAATKVNGSRTLNQEAGFTAPDAPGTFYFGGNVFQAAEKEGRTSWCDPNDLKRLKADIAAARAKADAVVVLAHCHDIRADKYWEPDYYFEEFCRAAIDSGAAAVFGGGTHQLKGIELRNSCPIFYSLGDFVFQNSVTPSVPPDFCEQYGVPLDSTAKVAHNARSKGGKVGLHTDRANFLSVIPKIELVDGKVKRVTMMPIELHFAHDWSVNGLPRPADEKASADIESALARLSAEFGTEIVRLPGGILEARPRSAAAGNGSEKTAAAQRTKALFFFDTEEYTDPKSSDAIVSIANMLTEEGVRGHFAFVGYLAKKLVDWRRTDVMNALKPHLIGTQTLYHSLHPNINEKTDIADFDEAYRRAAADEWLGIGMIAAALGREANEIMCAVMPGPSHSYAAFYLYADMGIPFFGGCGPVFRDGRHGEIWYCNQRHLPYSAEGAGGIHLEHFMRPAKDEDAWIARQLDSIAKLDTVTFYMHPHMAIKAAHPDGFNWDKRNMMPYGKWMPPPNRDPLDTAEYYVRLRKFVRRLKADPRFEITDCSRLLAEQKPRKAITRAEVPAIRAALAKRLGPVEAPASWSVSDCFQAAVRLMRGEKEYVPGKVYGFLESPVGVSAPIAVKAVALKDAAKGISLERFLPPSIDVGGVRLGAADFMFAALEAIETGADEVKVEPREQLGDMKALMPGLVGYSTKGKWRYMPSYEDRYLSDRLRLQLWTLRYE